jgi:hypothetical protein
MGLSTPPSATVVMEGTKVNGSLLSPLELAVLWLGQVSYITKRKKKSRSLSHKRWTLPQSRSRQLL